MTAVRWGWDFGVALGEADSARLIEVLRRLAETGALGSAAAGVGNPRGHFMASLGGALSDANGLAFFGRLSTLKTSLAA